MKYFKRELIDQKRWHVLYTRPNLEKMINKNLIEQGLYSYLPLQKELRYWNDRKVWIEKPLFRSYIFVKTSLREKDKVFSTYGIISYLKFGSQLAIIKEDEIDRIKKLCLYQGDVDIEFENKIEGRKVEIVNGVLKGLEGILTSIDENRKVHIHIGGLNCFANVTVDLRSINLKYIS
jgi:transcription antitermination factor NusG